MTTLASHRTMVQQNRYAPVLFFATFGAIVVLFDIWLFAAWFSSPFFATNTVGRELVPANVRTMVRANEIANTLFCVLTVWFVLIRPWRRTGEITFAGLFLLAMVTMLVQSDLPNYTTYFYQENTYAINFGSFMGVFPGVRPPNLGRQADFVFMNLGCIWSNVVPMIITTMVVNRVRGHWPNLSKLQTIAVAYGFLLIYDFVLESGFLRTDAFTYGYTIGALTLFKGERYQFPVYEIVLWGALLTSFFTLWYFRDDKGDSFAERGVERFRLGRAKAKWVRFFAIVGAINVFALTYNVAINVIQLYADYSIIDKLPPYLNPL
jgi:hypothetical protein